MNAQNKFDSDRMHCLHRRFFSWSAVIVGALVGVGISFLLNLFNISIGLTAFATATPATAPTLALGGFLGLIIGAIFSMGVLGWVAGYLGGLKCISFKRDNTHFCNYGCLYGFTAWCFALVLTILLSAEVGKFISSTMVALTNPSVAVQTMAYSAEQRAVARPSAPTTQLSPVEREQAAKNLAMTSFATFVLFLIGALTASITGHIAYAVSARKHRDRI